MNGRTTGDTIASLGELRRRVLFNKNNNPQTNKTDPLVMEPTASRSKTHNTTRQKQQRIVPEKLTQIKWIPFLALFASPWSTSAPWLMTTLRQSLGQSIVALGTKPIF